MVMAWKHRALQTAVQQALDTLPLQEYNLKDFT